MSGKIYLNLLILCGILSQGITGTSFEDNDENSLKLQLRNKRMISGFLGENREVSITEVNYIVKVLRNGEKNCVGIIVTPELILTIVACIAELGAVYSVESGQITLTEIRTHRIINRMEEGPLVLLVIRPFISVQWPSLFRHIIPYEEPVSQFAMATIAGLGPTIEGYESPNFRLSTNVPIVSPGLCSSYYTPHNIPLTTDNICALEIAGERGCSHTDLGSALVLNDKLVGVLIFPGRTISSASPDIFIRVNNNNTYNRWIKQYMGPYLHNHANSAHPLNQHPYHQNLHNPNLHK